MCFPGSAARSRSWAERRPFGSLAQAGTGVTGFTVDDEVYGQANTLLGGTGSLAELVAASARVRRTGKLASKTVRVECQDHACRRTPPAHIRL